MRPQKELSLPGTPAARQGSLDAPTAAAAISAGAAAQREMVLEDEPQHPDAPEDPFTSAAPWLPMAPAPNPEATSAAAAIAGRALMARQGSSPRAQST